MSEPEKSAKPLIIFFGVLGALAPLRLALGFAAVPLGLVLPVSILMTVIFIAAPVLALYRAASYAWTAKTAWLFLGGGVLVHIPLQLLAQNVLTGFPAALAAAVAQVGLVTWCVGLGALLTMLLKDKNLLIPVSVFLAAFDIFLVFTPVGFTQQIMRAAPQALPTVGYAVPQVTNTPTSGPVGAFAYIGPADFLFMGMFFVALFRFRMRTRETLIALIPALLVYLLLAAVLGPIPLLVPIGLTVLLVNIAE
ncbi:MAG TPA: hypothetical protein VEX38_10440, partial [Fimbriimonadaceae bacterium]|nr:hypothetical protein [Fimbriimonadaceae bacterium]